MKNGLIMENGELIYYQDDQPVHAGVVKSGRHIYYISSGGRAVKGQHIVHREMTNGILKRGTYTFGDDYRLVRGSYIPPTETKGRKGSGGKRKAPKKAVLVLSGILLIVLIILACADFVIERKQAAEDETVENYYDQSAVQVYWPTFEEELLLCSPTALEISQGETLFTPTIARGDSPYVPAEFEYRLVNCTGTLLLSEDPSMANARKYDLPTGAHSLELDNLKTGTTYYFQAEANGETHTGTFQTAVSPRFLNVEGLTNLRDIGGYTNLDGKTVKQGLLIRGSEPDGLVEPTYFLADSSISIVRDTFGFAYQMDLRSPNVYTGDYLTRIGTNVVHQFYGAPQYGQIFSSTAHKTLQTIFKDLADPAKYPIYMHCTHGADRTGTVIFLLQGILNMSQEDMIREYQRTGYAFSQYADSDQLNVIIEGLQSYHGNSLQEKIITYLTTEVGLTEADLDAIRNIYLEN